MRIIYVIITILRYYAIESVERKLTARRPVPPSRTLLLALSECQGIYSKLRTLFHSVLIDFSVLYLIGFSLT